MSIRRTDAHFAIVLLAGASLAGHAAAGINVLDRGTSSPSTTVPTGPSMGKPVNFAPADGRPTFSIVPNVTITPSTILTLDGVTVPGGLEHRRSGTGEGWTSWRTFEIHDVYTTVTPAPVNRIVLDVVSSKGVDYFSVHALGISFDTFNITAKAFDSSGEMISSTQSATSSPMGGAVGWAFWTTGGTTIQRIELETADPLGFAVAEFGVHEVPAPGTLGALGLAGLIAGRRRRI